MTHEECQDRFAELLYGGLEPDDAAVCREHLRGCDGCAKAFAALESTRSLMDRRVRDEPGEAYWASYWSRIESRIGSTAPKSEAASRRPTPIFRLPSAWLAGAAAILLVGFGIYLGRNILGTAPSPAEVALQPPTALHTSGEDSLAARTASYLERSKVLLQGIVNQDDLQGTFGSVERQRRISRQLIGEAHVLSAALKQPDQQQVRELIADLQIILLQLANIEVEPGTPAIELVKQGVDHKSILLKIRVEELRALSRRTSTQAAADTARTHL